MSEADSRNSLALVSVIVISVDGTWNLSMMLPEYSPIRAAELHSTCSIFDAIESRAVCSRSTVANQLYTAITLQKNGALCAHYRNYVPPGSVTSAGERILFSLK